ncbi:hypothetical protein GCM10009624_24140 [Gordonia sinesedis]
MNSEGCWSTVVVTAHEQQALGLSGTSEWIQQCRLAVGHRGNHATDASTFPRHDRRMWLEWNDRDSHAQSLIQRNPCPVPSPEGAACVFFHGHGGPHFYARSNGHAPSAMSGMNAAPGSMPPPSPRSAPPRPRYDDPLRVPPGAGQGPGIADPTRPQPPGHRGPSTGDLPVAGHVGSHRLGEPVRRVGPPEPAPSAPPPLPPEAVGDGARAYAAETFAAGPRARDADPPERTRDQGRRHRLGEPSAPSSDGRYESATSTAQVTFDDRVAAALDEVVDALAKLADALRRR